MAEYIDKKVVKKTIEQFRLSQTVSKYLTKKDCDLSRNAIERTLYVIDNIPAADAALVVHAHWISNDYGGYKWTFNCSNCGWADGHPFDDRHNYCPNCGAKMRKE